MKTGKIIAIDLAPTKTGWGLFDTSISNKPQEYGLVALPEVSETEFPWNYMAMTDRMIELIMVVVNARNPDWIVVEQSNLGKQRGSQKRIEWCHYALAAACRAQYKDRLHFCDSSAWRSFINLRLSKDQKKSNAKLSKAKKAAAEVGETVDKKALGIQGKVNWKHLSWERANREYGLKLLKKDNDISDALNLGEAFLLGVKTNEEP